MLNRIDTLATGHLQLPAKDQDFAKSLIRQHKIKGTLSDKQWLWVEKLADAIEGVPDFTLEAAPEYGPYGRLIAMFVKAQSPKLKSPSISLSLECGHDVTLKLQNGQFGAWLRIGSKWGTVHGLVDAKGFLKVKTFGHSQETVQAAMTKALDAMTVDPEGFASTAGKAAGCCIFCNSELTGDNSMAWGYGPTCAKNWHLPHGKKK